MKPTPLMLTCLIGLAVPMLSPAQPTITVQPQSQTNVVGTDAIFTVGVTGTAPLAYQWQFYSSDLAAMTNETLFVTNVQTAKAGSYVVVVTNVTGAVTSEVATLTVLVPPTITRQPSNQSVSLGANVTFIAFAAGTAPRFFQWRFNETNLLGNNSTSLVLTNLQLTNAGGYTVVVTNVAGSVTSQVATLTVDPTFSKITSGLIVTRAGSGRGCAWGDYNDDGFIDLYVANSAIDGGSTTGGADFLFQNNRDGTFTEKRAAARILDPVDSQGCVWADYDNDGQLDLFVSAYFGSRNTLYRNQGEGAFTKVGTDKFVSEGDKSTAAAWGDFNNDGFVDLVVANSLTIPSSSPSLDLFYQNLGEAGFLKLTNNIVSERRYGRGVSWADYDNDGRIDLFVANSVLGGTQQLNRLYRNLGEGIFQPVTGPGPGEKGRNSYSGSWADYDNDGDLDLFVANGGWEQVRTNFLYRNSGDGTFSEIAGGDIVTDQSGSVYGAWGDYDNDGFLDLFVSHSSIVSVDYYAPTAKNSLYHNNGDGTFTKVKSGSLVNDLGCSFGCAWGDYDNDGFLDLFVTNFGSRVNDLFHNSGNTNSWIVFKCVGTISNRSAIGAKVRMRATIRGRTTWQLREISGGGGYMSQNDLRAHFGLGDATSIDLVRIEWPSGIVQELYGVTPKQFLTVTEPARLEALGAGAFRIQSWKGMAFEVQASADLAQWSPVTTMTNFTGTLEFTDPDAVNQESRFYRAVLR